MISQAVRRDYRYMTADIFWARTDRSNGCWLWTGSIDRKGYGKVGFDGKLWIASRLAWLFANGDLPINRLVCHSCDIDYSPDDITYRRCIRPDHLWLGDCLSNLQDMVRKGRANHRRPAQGERVNTAKLTTEQVIAIRTRHEAGMPIQPLADEYGIAYQNIRAIVLRQHWKHLPLHPVLGVDE
jgi:hypothetical protein